MSSYMMPAQGDYAQEMAMLFVQNMPALLREVETGLYQNNSFKTGKALHSLVNNLSAVESGELAVSVRDLEEKVSDSENLSALSEEWKDLKRDIMPVIFKMCSHL